MGLSQAIENYIEQKRSLAMVFRVQSTTIRTSKDRFRLLDASVCQRLFTHSRRFASLTSTPKITSPTPANKMRNEFTASCALG